MAPKTTDPITRGECQALHTGLEKATRDSLGRIEAQTRSATMETREAFRTITTDQREIRDLVVDHLGQHTGSAKTAGEATAQVSRKIATWSTIGAWARAVLVALAMLVAAVLFLTANGQAHEEKLDGQRITHLEARLDRLITALERKPTHEP